MQVTQGTAWNMLEAQPPRLVRWMDVGIGARLTCTPLVTYLAAAKRRGSRAQHRNAGRLEYP
jgi:hypothetical protein